MDAFSLQTLDPQLIYSSQQSRLDVAKSTKGRIINKDFRGDPPLPNELPKPTSPTWLDYLKDNNILFDASDATKYDQTRIDELSQKVLERPAYGGWAVASGEFNSTSLGPEVAISIPRAQDKRGILTGKVVESNVLFSFDE